LDAAFAEFNGLEAREALADGAEFGVVHARAAGELKEAELELFFGELFDGGVVVGLDLVAGEFGEEGAVAARLWRGGRVGIGD
jgi:hypothetical protein